MSRHIELEIADVVAERLSERRRREIEDHLKQCEPCATELAWAERLRDEALRQGLRHLQPMRVVELAARPDEANRAEQEHLAGCRACSDELEWARRVAEDDETDAETESALPTRRRLWPWLGAAAAAVVVTILLLPRGPDTDFAEFALIEPLPVRITRDAAPAESFEESRLLGLEAYSSGNWEVAAEHLASALDRRPDDGETLLYLGSAELLDGRYAAASGHLHRARDGATDPRVRDEASWQLANLDLVERRTDAAVAILREIAAGEGHRRSDARALLDRMP